MRHYDAGERGLPVKETKIDKLMSNIMGNTDQSDEDKFNYGSISPLEIAFNSLTPDGSAI